MIGVRCDSVDELAGRYDVFLIDQFGVLHDGVSVYPGILDALMKLSDAGRRVVILSNSGRRSSLNVVRLANMGIPPDAYTMLVSSGEVVWSALARRSDPFFAELGSRCLLLSRGGDTSVIDGLDLERVPDAEQADFVLLAGSDAPQVSFDDYKAILAPALARGLPLICANPDVIQLTPEGHAVGAGRIAKYYKERGGTVHWIGKPHGEIYRFSLDQIGPVPRDRVLAIGDSIEHDVAGAARLGIATAFIECGIHADATEEELASLCRKYEVTPDWRLPRLKR